MRLSHSARGSRAARAVPPSARARRAPDRQSGRAGKGEREGTSGLRAARVGLNKVKASVIQALAVLCPYRAWSCHPF